MLDRLRAVVRAAKHNTRYYADLFRRIGFDADRDFSSDEFATLPILDREDVLTHGDDMISRAAPYDQLRRDASGGSTGQPVSFWVGPTEDGWHGSAREYFMRQVGVPRGSRIAYLWGHHLDPVKQASVAKRINSMIANERWYDCFRLSPDVIGQYHRKLEAYKPDCIVAYAAALAALAEFLADNYITPTYPRRCIVTGAEKLYQPQRELVEQVFRKPVHERYGSRDVGLMGFQLGVPRNLEFTVDWVNLFIEPEVENTESGIIVTKLRADGMPFIRYRTGDTGIFPTGSRPGYPVYSLNSVCGRSVDRIWLQNGSFIHGNQFPHMLKDYPVHEFMVVQAADYSIEIQIVPRRGFTESDRSGILATVQSNLPGLEVCAVLVESITRTKANKWRPVITHVARRRSLNK